uniref:Myb-like domain-containing protein n=1 Tax=Kalanchoe fedtschenkoi TaxID=63787 RepID=A0A7N0RCS6_KALFE
MVDKSMNTCRNPATESVRGWHSSAIRSHNKTKPEVVSHGNGHLICDSVVTFSSIVNNGSPHHRDNDAFFTEKRSRKWYIDEYSKYHSVHTNKRTGSLSKNSKKKSTCLKSRYQDCINRNVREKKTLRYSEYMTEAIQVPFGPLVLKECSRKKAFVPSVRFQRNGTDFNIDITSVRDKEYTEATFLHPSPDVIFERNLQFMFAGPCDPEDHSKAIAKISEVNTNTELSLAPSQDERSDDNDLGEVTSDKSGRKHNRYWSDYEITILIEGVAKYGVGRWTDIKRGLFPPTTRRTSVDLKVSHET